MRNGGKTYLVNVKQNISSYHLFSIKAYSLDEARELAMAEAEKTDFDPSHVYYTIDSAKLIVG